jgi:hypothetical protein
MPRAKSKSSEDTFDDCGWASLLQASLIRPGPPPGRGWKTTEQVASEMGRTRSTAQYRIARWIKAGMVEVEMGIGDRNQPIRYIRPRTRATG